MQRLEASLGWLIKLVTIGLTAILVYWIGKKVKLQKKITGTVKYYI